jgi:hypothetical protein
MLQGTFETLGLTEVLSLLAHAHKTGALWLEAGPSSAVVYIAEGRCNAVATPDAADPIDDPTKLMARLVDACFAVSRVEDGSFRFASDESTWSCPQAVDLDVALDELARLLDEWREIQVVIPSLDCRVRLADELGVDELTVDRDRWALIVAVDGRRTVRELGRRTGRAVLDVCHSLLALVDAGAVTIVAPPAQGVSGRTTGAGKATRPVVEPESPYGPGVESPHPGPVGSDADEREAAAGGGFLRVYSGS